MPLTDTKNSPNGQAISNPYGTDLSDLLCVPMRPHASLCVPLNDINRALISAGASLHWLRVKAKRPIASNWSNISNQTESDLSRNYRIGQNIGIRLGEPSQVGGDFLYLVDLDIRDAGKATEAWNTLLTLWPAAKAFPSVISGSGGDSRHIYFLSEVPMRKQKLACGIGWEIDMMGTGSQAVLPPSIHPKTHMPYLWERPLELDFPLAMRIDESTLARFGTNMMRTATHEPTAQLKELNSDHVAHALDSLNVDDRDDWLKAGMALHHQFDGSKAGFTKWQDWAQRSDKFNSKDSTRVWKSFKNDKNNLKGLRSLFSDVGIAGYESYSLDYSAEDFDDLPVQSAETKRAKVGLIVARNGDMKPTLHNAILVLGKVNKDQGYNIRKNDMTAQDEWRGGPINDGDLGLIRVAMEQEGMHNVGSDLTAGAVRGVAEKNRYHPVKDWLDGLRHDGKPRLDTWLSQYLQVADSPYSRAVGRAFMVAMVARIMQPGCKHDHVLVLQGGQGIGKSTACRVLGGEWSGDNMPSIRDGGKEAGLYLKGHWLVEMAELVPSRKAEAEDLKAFLTRGTDEIRAPYARRADVVPRQCVFVGTTNEDSPLRDASGGRRFWPVTCGATIDTTALAADREQLFAEAVAAYQTGEAWHLSHDLEQQAAIEQENAREEHPWERPIRCILDGLTDCDGFDRQPRDTVTISELLKSLEIPVERHLGKASRDAALLLRMFGWKKRRTNSGMLWERP